MVTFGLGDQGSCRTNGPTEHSNTFLTSLFDKLNYSPEVKFIVITC